MDCRDTVPHFKTKQDSHLNHEVNFWKHVPLDLTDAYANLKQRKACALGVSRLILVFCHSCHLDIPFPPDVVLKTPMRAIYWGIMFPCVFRILNDCGRFCLL